MSRCIKNSPKSAAKMLYYIHLIMSYLTNWVENGLFSSQNVFASDKNLTKTRETWFWSIFSSSIQTFYPLPLRTKLMTRKWIKNWNSWYHEKVGIEISISSKPVFRLQRCWWCMLVTSLWCWWLILILKIVNNNNKLLLLIMTLSPGLHWHILVIASWCCNLQHESFFLDLTLQLIFSTNFWSKYFFAIFWSGTTTSRSLKAKT